MKSESRLRADQVANGMKASIPARSAIRAISRTDGQLNLVRSSARVGRAPPPMLAKNTPSLSLLGLNSGFARRTLLPRTFTSSLESVGTQCFPDNPVGH